MISIVGPWMWLTLAGGCFWRRDALDSYMAQWPPLAELYSSPVTRSNGVDVQCGLFRGGPFDGYTIVDQPANVVRVLTTITNTRNEPIEVAVPNGGEVWVTSHGLIVRPVPPDEHVSGPIDSQYFVRGLRLNPGAKYELWSELRTPYGTPGPSQMAELWNVRTPGLVEQPLVCVAQWRALSTDVGQADRGIDDWQDATSEAIPLCALLNPSGWSIHPCGRMLGDR